MKKILVTLMFFVAYIGFSQNNGITYQAVIYGPNGQQLPGANNLQYILSNKPICLRFSIIDHQIQIEYQETFITTTDTFGMVNLLIGTGIQIGGYANGFNGITWNINTKSLKVELDISQNCQNFTEISYNPFTYVPFAYYSANAGNPGPPGPQGPQGVTGATGAQGPAGTNGTNGSNGLSAYQIWLNAGNTGTETQFLNSLQGATGPTGATGPQGPIGLTGATGAQGPAGTNGTNGSNGLSAYQIWLNAGNTGTETQFLTSLQGAQGAQGPAGPLVNGTSGQTLRHNGSSWEASSTLINSNGSIGIGTSTVQASAILNIQSESKGILLPSLTETQRLAISSPATGLLVFQNTTPIGFYFYDGANWQQFGINSSSSGSSDKTLLYTTKGF